MIFLSTLSGFESHKISCIRLLISCNRVFGTGKDMNRWTCLGKNKVLISVILPKGDKNLLSVPSINFLHGFPDKILKINVTMTRSMVKSRPHHHKSYGVKTSNSIAFSNSRIKLHKLNINYFILQNG